MSQKYRKDLTPNITFQPNEIFLRNDWAVINADANAIGADSSTFKITDAKLYYQLLLYQQKTVRDYKNY